MARHGTRSVEFAQCDGVGPRTQYGALCWRMHRDRVEVLLITSRDTGRWVIPKGWPMAGKTPQAAAAQEAWEEAGVTGAVDATCAGLYSYNKVLSPTDAVPCAVAVYGLRVAKLSARFPERRERRRKWFAVEKAARKVLEAELRSLLLGFSPGKPESALPGAQMATQPESALPGAQMATQPDAAAVPAQDAAVPDSCGLDLSPAPPS